MNFLFTFEELIDIHCLGRFEAFCWEIGKIDCVFCSANDPAFDDEEFVEFPANYILAIVDTEDEELLKIINDKYLQLLSESQHSDYNEEHSH